MGFAPPVALAVTLVALAPMTALAQAGGNPWNPYPATSAQSAPPLARPTPDYVAPVQRRQVPDRFAPAGLEQQLSIGVAPLAAPVPPTSRTAPQTTYQVPVPLAYAAPAPARSPVPGGYASPPGGFAPRGYGLAPYAPGYGGSPAPGWGGGYPQGLGNNGYPGYGAASPYNPYAIPGGLGGFAPFPGNNTNGGVPGFNFSPFGFF